MEISRRLGQVEDLTATLPKTVLFVIIGLISTVLIFGAMSLLGQYLQRAFNKVLGAALDTASEMASTARTGLSNCRERSGHRESRQGAPGE